MFKGNAILIKVTVFAAILSILSGCADERGFRPKQFPKTLPSGPGVSGQIESKDPRDQQRPPEENPAPKSAEERQKTDESINDVQLWYQKFVDSKAPGREKIEDIIKNLTKAEIAGEVIKAASIMPSTWDTSSTPIITLLTSLTIDGQSLDLRVRGYIDFKNGQITETSVENINNPDQAVENVKAFGAACLKGWKCQGAAMFFMKVTLSKDKVINAYFMSYPGQNVVSSNINATMPSFDAYLEERKKAEKEAADADKKADEDAKKKDEEVRRKAEEAAKKKEDEQKEAAAREQFYQKYNEHDLLTPSEAMDRYKRSLESGDTKEAEKRAEEERRKAEEAAKKKEEEQKEAAAREQFYNKYNEHDLLTPEEANERHKQAQDLAKTKEAENKLEEERKRAAAEADARYKEYDLYDLSTPEEANARLEYAKKAAEDTRAAEAAAAEAEARYKEYDKYDLSTPEEAKERIARADKAAAEALAAAEAEARYLKLNAHDLSTKEEAEARFAQAVKAEQDAAAAAAAEARYLLLDAHDLYTSDEAKDRHARVQQATEEEARVAKFNEHDLGTLDEAKERLARAQKAEADAIAAQEAAARYALLDQHDLLTLDEGKKRLALINDAARSLEQNNKANILSSMERIEQGFGSFQVQKANLQANATGTGSSVQVIDQDGKPLKEKSMASRLFEKLKSLIRSK